MERNGIAFVALMLLIAFLGNKITDLIQAAFGLGAIYIAARLFFWWLKGVKLQPTKNATVGFVRREMRENYIPAEFDFIEQFLLSKLRTNGEDGRTTMAGFLKSIGVHDGSRHFPDYFYNGVAKKMLWEYRRKYGHLEYPKTKGTITINEVSQPIDEKDRDAFHEFCMQHTL